MGKPNRDTTILALSQGYATSPPTVEVEPYHTKIVDVAVAPSAAPSAVTLNRAIRAYQRYGEGSTKRV